MKRRGKDDTFIKQLEFALLPILNGEKILVESEDNGEPTIQFSTYNTLIFAMGVFPEIPANCWNNLTSARTALIRYGFSPQLVSRFTHFIKLENLKQSDCEVILQREVESLKLQYQTNDFIPYLKTHQLKRIAKETLRSPFGVRGAKVEINQILANQAAQNAIDHMI